MHQKLELGKYPGKLIELILRLLKVSKNKDFYLSLKIIIKTDFVAIF